MPNVTLICVGGLKEDYWKDACDEYIKRAGAWVRINTVELPEERLPAHPSPANIDAALGAEAKRILLRLPERALIVALCVEGRQMSTQEFTGFISHAFNTSQGGICFIIGGSNGLSGLIKERADVRLSLSQMTFPHMVARALLLEQLYRALSILGGGKYHK